MNNHTKLESSGESDLQSYQLCIKSFHNNQTRKLLLSSHFGLSNLVFVFARKYLVLLSFRFPFPPQRLGMISLDISFVLSSPHKATTYSILVKQKLRRIYFSFSQKIKSTVSFKKMYNNYVFVYRNNTKILCLMTNNFCNWLFLVIRADNVFQKTCKMQKGPKSVAARRAGNLTYYLRVPPHLIRRRTSVDQAI